MTKIKEYKETHQYGRLSVEMPLDEKFYDCDLGIQIATDGRIWLCIDGKAALRFKPTTKITCPNCNSSDIQWYDPETHTWKDVE